MAGVLYSNDLAGLTGGSALAGWSLAGGVGMMIQPNGVAGAVSPKANGYGRNSVGDSAYWNNNAGVKFGDQVMRHRIIVPDPSAFVGHIVPGVRLDPATGFFYQIGLVSNATQYGISIVRKDSSGVSTIAANVFALTAVSGDDLQLEISAIGTTISARIWKTGTTYPAAPTVTASDSSLATGYPYLVNGAGAWRLTGDLVVTDGTVSSGVFDAAPDTTAPTVASIAVANGTPSVVNLTMSENMDTGSVPAASAFTVSGHTVSSVAITGNAINLTLSAPFVFGEAARTVAYTQPGTNNARDLASTPNLLANFTGQAITNNVAAPGDTTAPGFSLAQVLNSAPTQVVITMNETLAAFTPAASAFAVSGGKTVSSVARSGATITLTCSAAYAYGDTITVTYTKPGTNMLQDAAGNQTASFGPSAVTNSIAAPSGALVTLPGYIGEDPGYLPSSLRAWTFRFASLTDATSAGVLATVTKTTDSAGNIAPWTQTGLTPGTDVEVTGRNAVNDNKFIFKLRVT